MEKVAQFTVTMQEGLGAAPDTAKAKPHHVLNKDGSFARFRNPHASFSSNMGLGDGQGIPGMFHVARTFFSYRMAGKLETPDTTPPTVTVRKPTFWSTRWPASTTTAAVAERAEPVKEGERPLRATWLGHACYYIEFPTGLRVLFDPVFEDHCAPVAWGNFKRFTPAPCVLADLPAVDAVVISHNHYDHLSAPSVTTLRQHHPRAHFFVGLGVADWFRRAGIHAVTELDWWQDADATVTFEAAAEVTAKANTATATGTTPTTTTATTTPSATSLTARFSCLPSQHTSARGIFDRDRTLWCSWAVSSGGRSVFFGGDTGYRSVDVDEEDLLKKDAADKKSKIVHGPTGADATSSAALVAADEAVRAMRPGCPDFAHIGRLRGPFDLGLLPIGAYKPRSLFSSMHADPVDAVDIFRDTRCRRAMGMHWGTWTLTSEPVMEPPRKLRDALRRRGLPETGVFDVCDIGESREF